MRIKFSKKIDVKESVSQKNVVTDIYKITLTDISTKGFILLKHLKKMTVDYQVNDSFVIDKVKLVINPKGEVVLISTSLTVLRAESEESFTVESLELS